MADKANPVMFIHGLWLHPTSWGAWGELFSNAGYEVLAPGWPGDMPTVEKARANPGSVANRGIDDIVAHHAEIIDGLRAQPILVGHSFGGMFAEKLLGDGKGAAAVAIDSAQIKGVLAVPLAALHSTLPVFRNPANKHRSVMLTEKQFRSSFGNAVTEEESNQLYDRWVIPGPGRPLFEAAAANFSPHSPAKVDTKADRGPLLLIAGGKDRTVPEAITKSTLKQYDRSPSENELLVFADRGHSLTIDSGWREVAEAALQWLDKHGL
jgi:pimeloyl-ACP methyl ester carboxylesterase